MSTTQGHAGPVKNLSNLVGEITENVSSLVRLELELVQAEVKDTARKGAIGGGMLGVAAALAALAGLLITFAIVYALSNVMPVWAAFLVVAVAYLLIGGIVGYLGYRELQRIQIRAAPDEAKKTVDALQSTVKSASARPALPPALGPPVLPLPPANGAAPSNATTS